MATLIELNGVAPAGVPAAEQEQLSGSALRWTQTAADESQQSKHLYTNASRVVSRQDDARIA